MEKNYIYSPLFKIFYQSTILILLIVSLILPIINKNSLYNDLIYFTNISNFFIFFLFSILLINSILNLFNIKTEYEKKLPFTIIWLLITHMIIVTLFIFCFVLLPLSVLFDPTQISSFMQYNTISIHVIIPLLSICYFIIYSNKDILDYKDAFFCLIMPTLYYFYVNVRVLVDDKNLLNTLSPYPYFFLDPNYHNQGYISIVFYVIFVMLIFYFVGIFLIFLYKKCYKKTSQIN